MYIRTRIVWSALALALVGAAACGGGDDIGPPSVTPPTPPGTNDARFTVGGESGILDPVPDEGGCAMTELASSRSRPARPVGR